MSEHSRPHGQGFRFQRGCAVCAKHVTHRASIKSIKSDVSKYKRQADTHKPDANA